MIVENIEYDVINEKNKYDENIYVSVYCSTFNHVNYIAESLDNILAQKCKYKYQIVVIDDCSNDGTTEILRKYCKAYPNKICGIIARENTYNNPMRWSIYKKIIKDFCIGKYIAMCETDDYWCDANKLLKQINYLELHQECVMSLHNGLLKNCKTGNVSVMNSMNKEGDVSVEDIITQKYGNWPTASMVLKKEMFFMDDFFNLKNVGDWPLRMHAVLNGRIHYFPEVMSVYRYMTSGSWTMGMYSGNEARLFLHRLQMIKFLQEYDKFTSNEYGAAVYTRMHTFLPKLYELGKIDLKKLNSIYLSYSQHRDLREAYDLYKSYVEYYRSELKDMKKIRKFINKFNRIYIYGTGEYAQNLSKILHDDGIVIDGYVISDGQKISKLEKPVSYISEILGQNVGIIIAISPTNMLFIRETLQKISSNNLYYFYIFPEVLKYLNKKNIDKFINAHEEQNGEISINERAFTTMYNS